MAEKKSSSKDAEAEPKLELPKGVTPEMAEESKRSLGAINSEGPTVEEKTLTSTTPEETEETGTVLEGAADKWLCVAKAYNEKEGWMKTTKAMQIGSAGCLIQVTTQQKNRDGTWSVAEAVCFAERVNLTVDGGVPTLS